MTVLERMVDALVRLAVTDDLCRQAQIREELKGFATGQRIPGTVEEEIDLLLQELCYPENVLGYRYSVICIRLCVEDPKLLDIMHRGVYPAACGIIGNITNKRLEQRIRSGIELMFENCDPRVIDRYFANCVSKKTGMLSTGTFLRRMTREILQRMGMEVSVC